MRTPTLCALALLLLTLPAAAYERTEIRTRDSVLGTITAAESTHEYLIQVPRDAVLSLSLPRVKSSRLLGSMGVLNDTYRGVALFQAGKRKVQFTSPAGSSATYRALVQGVSGSEGEYRLKPKIKVRTRYKIRGKRSDLSPPGSITFGALAGYEAQIKITWAGPDPVLIDSFTGPSGEDVTSETVAKQKKKSFVQKGFALTTTGDHRVTLAIPPSANRWSLQVTLKGKPQGEVHDLRAEHVKPPQLLLEATTGPNPLIRIVGESGGPNELVVGGAGRQPTIFGVYPDPPEQCTIAPTDSTGTPAGYEIRCDESHSADVLVGSRDGARTILDFVADPIVTPGGTGKAELSELEYTSSGSTRLTGWTEIRTFDASGNVHKIVVRDVQRFSAGAFTYSVEHTAPDGSVRNYDYLPFQ